MHYSLRSFLLFVAGVAIIVFAGIRNLVAFQVAIILFGAVIGSIIGRHRFWSSCLFGGLGGAVASWIGLMLRAFVLPWDYFIPDPQQRADFRKVYQTFLGETFFTQSAFVMFAGFLIGVVMAIIVYVLTKVVQRLSLSRSQYKEELTT